MSSWALAKDLKFKRKMKNFKNILVFCMMLLCAASCKEETYGPSSFSLQEEMFGTILFEYGQTRQLSIVQENIKVLYVKCTESWKGSVEGNMLTITAPSQDEVSAGFGEIGLYARGYDDIEWILKLGVEVRFEVKDGERTSWNATREENALVGNLWKPGDVIRAYDSGDIDGYDFDPYVTIPSAGMPEVGFDGVVSEGASDVYAVYPSDRALVCSAEGVLSGMELSAEQPSSVPVLAVAKEKEGVLAFRNVYAYLTATFEDGMIARLEVEDTDGDCALAGKFSYDINSMTATVSQKESLLTLLPPSGSTAFAAGTYSFACLPENLAGLKITAVTTSGKRLEKIGSTPVAFERNNVYDLGKFKNELTLVDKSAWQILYANSEMLENFSGQNYIGSDGDSYSGSANDMIDGDYASFWSYNYLANGAQKAASLDYLPYYIVIDLGEEKTISSMALTARQPGGTNAMAEYNDKYASQVARMTVEFASSITKRGMADVLDHGASQWSGAETFDESVLKNQKVNKVDFKASHKARYVRLTIREGYKNTSEAIPSYTGGTLAEFDLFSAAGSDYADKISKSAWKIVYAKSERLENYGGHGFTLYGGFTGAVRHMIDDNYLSIWSYHGNPTHSSAIPTVRALPYYFVIDFGKEIEVGAFRLTNKWAKNNFADQNSFASGPGAVTLEFSNSISGRGMDDVLENGKYISSEWTVYKESFDHTKIRKQKSMTVPLAQKVRARYCRFTINKVYKDADADGNAPTGGYGTSLAEIDFLE